MDSPHARPRSPQDLIAELDAAGREHLYAALAVARREEPAAFFMAGQAFRLFKLARLLREEGGVPLGLIVMDRMEGPERQEEGPQGRLIPVACLFPDLSLTDFDCVYSWPEPPRYSDFPPDKLRAVAQETLEIIADDIVDQLEWDAPYGPLIDRAIETAIEAKFTYPLRVCLYFRDSDKDEHSDDDRDELVRSFREAVEHKGFTLFRERMMDDPEDAEEYEYVIERGKYGLVTHRDGFGPDDPRPFPPYVIVVSDSRLPRCRDLSLYPGTGKIKVDEDEEG